MTDFDISNSRRLGGSAAPTGQARAKSPGELVLSLDFELIWGVIDHADRKGYGRNILGARRVLPRMLDLLASADIAATWATVGFLMCDDRDELRELLPDLRPSYADPHLSAYAYLDSLGRSEEDDPFAFAPSLLRDIRQTPGQEIATHTLSHFYCMAPGSSVAAFRADLSAAIDLAARKGIALRSIVFPRNQYGPEHLAVCAELGLTRYRGARPGAAYRPAQRETHLRRGLRLADAYSGVLGSGAFRPSAAPGALGNVPASRFLRPPGGRLAAVHPLHLSLVQREMTGAARRGLGYHLWWHPHNFGADPDASLAALGKLVTHFRRLADKYGMVSRNMARARTAEETA